MTNERIVEILKEALNIIELEKSDKLKYSGLCIYMDVLYFKGYITFAERSVIVDNTIKPNCPVSEEEIEKLKGYYWEKHKREPRVEYLKTLIYEYSK